jgi:beta-glucosidase
MKITIFKFSLLFLMVSALMAFTPESKTKVGVDNGKKPIYMNTAYSFEERAADLVSRLTLEEKQTLIGNTMAPIPRLGIGAYQLENEACHGIMGALFNPAVKSPTSFPNSAALGSAWDPILMEREAAAIADEGRGTNVKLIGLNYWAPVIEPARDPRWGRTGESFGEDPFLVSEIAGGFIRGMMGKDPVYLKTVPTAKHYFANNTEYNRHVSSSNMDARDMREYYLTPYKVAIERDKVPGIMSSYNAVNGVPTSASKFYLDTIARKTYGLKGYITGDCGAIKDIETGHFYAKSKAEAAAKGLLAGVDNDCEAVYQTSGIEAIKQGLIKEGHFDLALVNVMTMRMRTGEFDPMNMVSYSFIKADAINSETNRALALEVAKKTPVLLKNNNVVKTNNKALPLNPSSLKKIALIGPHAVKVELGPYSGAPAEENMISPLAGIKAYLSEKGLSTEVVSHEAANTRSNGNIFNVEEYGTVKTDGTKTIYNATKFDAAAKGVVATAGNSAIGVPKQVIKRIKDGDWTSYNNVDLTNVESLSISLTIAGEGTLVEARLGSATGKLLATFEPKKTDHPLDKFLVKTVTSKISEPGLTGKQTICFVYHSTPQAPVEKEAIAMASSSDVAIVFVGTDDKTAGEEGDRILLDLPGNQVELIKAVAAVNPNTIVVLQSLGMVEVDEFKDIPNIAGIIWTGFNGQAQGTAIASILFGETNPGGKLNATWYKSVNDLPDFTDYSLRGGNGKNGRTFWYFNKDVSYEFGYGLSYTNFEYSNFAISKPAITPNDKITVSVDVKNVGTVDGDEVVQLYMTTPESPASLQRPIKRLKGFKRVTIPAGQTQRVTIPVDCADLWFWSGELNKMIYDQGKYVFEIGSSSKNIKGKVEARMNGTLNPTLKTVMAECGKVVLKNGNTVQTSVTAAMSDDSFYDITKAKITYLSSNGSVAIVNEKGLVTAKGEGVASITAFVEINGKIVSDEYVLKVMPIMSLDGISVNGKKIADFKPEVHGYSYLFAAASTKKPQVQATTSNPNVTVEIDQAKGIPGDAIITLTNKITSDKEEYAVNFGIKSVGDEFDKTIGSQWNWVRENKSKYNLTKSPGSLTITSAKGDIVNLENEAENILVQKANTDWTAETKMVFSRRPSGHEAAGIIAYQDDDNYVKLNYGFNAGSIGFLAEVSEVLELVVETKGSQYWAVTINADDIVKSNNEVVLKLEKKGSLYTAYYSVDGKNFTRLGSAEAVLTDVKAGISVCDGVKDKLAMVAPLLSAKERKQDRNRLQVSYDYFHITNAGLK